MFTGRFTVKKAMVSFILSLVLLLGGLQIGVRAQSETEETNTFSILTYNIAGLPGFLSSADPAKNTKRIGELMNQFDLVAVQEDFAYHDELLEKASFPYVTEHPGNVPFGSGLNVLSKFPIKDDHNVPWRMTHGNLTCPPFGYHGADELTPKGFSYQLMELQPGAIVDVYNLHADAGSDEGSREARHDNFIQLAAYINKYSRGNAIILLGDTNAFYTRECDQLYVNLTEACGLTDPWIEYVRKGDIPAFRPYDDTLEDLNEDLSGPNYETVDKILYRSSQVVNFEFVNYKIQNELFLDEEGERLSDHFATSLTLDYTLSDTIQLSESFGGSGEEPFNYLPDMQDNKMTKVAIRSDDRLDAISISYADGETFSAGGQGGDYYEMNLDDNEYVTQITLHKGKKWNWDSHRVYYARLVTNKGNILAGGTMTNEQVTYVAPEGWYIAGFYGRSDSEIDQLGTIYKPIPDYEAPHVILSEAIGGTGGNPFNFIDDVTQPTKVSMREADRIDALAMSYGDIERFTGGNGGEKQELVLQENEFISNVMIGKGKKWHWSQPRVYYLKVVTNLGRTLEGGTMTDEQLAIQAPSGWQIAGFYGRSNTEIDQLGVIMIPIQ